MNLNLLRTPTSILVAALILTACSSAQPATTLSSDEIRLTAEAMAWTSITQTMAVGIDMIPSNTPNPAATITPIPQPIVLNGTGNSVVDFYWSGPGLAHINHTGAGNFIVESYDANNNSLHILVNKMGNYDGIVPINFSDVEQAVRFQVMADGAWAIAISPLTSARTFQLPAVITGVGDDVVTITGVASTITANTSESVGNFAVWARTQFGVELVFNEIAPYTGTALLNGYTQMLIISAEGNWTLAVNPR